MDLLTQIRDQIRTLLDQRATHQGVMDEIALAATARRDAGESGDLTDAETTRFNEARTALRGDGTDEHPGIDAELEAMQAREAELAEDERRRQAADALATRIGGPAAARPAGVQRVAEPELYHRDGEHSFFVDLYRSQVMHNQGAGERLARHNEVALAEHRAVGVGAFGGLVPPQYLLDEYAPVARAGRPFANSVRQVPLPADGTSFVIPRGTTGTTTDVQSSEGDTVDETDFDETDLSVSLTTIAGSQTMSRQSLERGQGNDRIIFGDLADDYAAKLDATYVASAIAVSGIESVTYTDASPTLPELFPKLADAVQRVNSKRFRPATAIWMHPRRWGWMTAALDTANRPLVSVEAPQNPVGVGMAAEYGQVVGSILGVPVITDANITVANGAGTNEDIILVGRAFDAILWEEGDGMPRELLFEQPPGKKLQVDLVAYGYSAFTNGRYPKAFAKVSGTGLVTPTF